MADNAFAIYKVYEIASSSEIRDRYIFYNRSPNYIAKIPLLQYSVTRNTVFDVY